VQPRRHRSSHAHIRVRLVLVLLSISFMFECIRRYLCACGVLWPSVVAILASCVVAIGGTYVELFVLDNGIAGAAFAFIASQWTALLVAVAAMAADHYWQRWKQQRTTTAAAAAGLPMHQVKRQLRVHRGSFGTSDDRLAKAATPFLATSATTSSSSSSSPLPSQPADEWLSSAPQFVAPSSSPPLPGYSSSPPADTDPGTRLYHRRQEADELQRKCQRCSPVEDKTRSDATELHFTGEWSSDAHAVTSAAGADEEEDAAALQLTSSPSAWRSWPSLRDRRVWSGWSPLLWLVVPGILSVLLEAGAFQASALVAAGFSGDDLAVHAIFMQTAGMLYVLPAGFGMAAAIAVGQLMGAARGKRVRDVVRISYVVALICPLLLGSLFIGFLRHSWPVLFSAEVGVQQRAAATMPVLLLYLCADHAKCIGVSLLRAMGRNSAIASTNLLACLLVGLPLIYTLCYPPESGALVGLWIGMAAAWLCASVAFAAMLAITPSTRTDAHEHEKEEEEQEEEEEVTGISERC
jgi:Na+-driven multidrug efflux pump